MGDLWEESLSAVPTADRHARFAARAGIRNGAGKSEAGGLDGSHSTVVFMIEGNKYNLFLKVLKNNEEF
ncbi:MAG TPA: hypothetical protein VNV60_12285 [Holophagaceae bacterium]|nr:hypothetical protein [Holophagaceae bacterium]